MSDDTFIIDDDDRYSRLRLIAWWEQEKLAKAKVLVVGAGALGNEVLKNLALMGVGSVYVIDFDNIEESNLTRSVLFRHRDCGRPKAETAAEALRDMNPDIKVYPMLANVITDLGLGMFRDVDVVIGCLDNREARLWVNRSCWKATTPWIDGGIQEINGVCKVFSPPDGACYECAMTENDYRLINLRYSCPLLRHEDLLAGKVPTAPTISSMIGGLQTQEALKLIHGMPVASGQALIYNGIANQFYNTKFQHREDCMSHDTYPEPVELDFKSSETTVRQLFDAVREQVGTGPLQLNLDRDLIVSVNCTTCGIDREIMQVLQSVGMKQAECPECGETARPEIIHTVTEDSPWLDLPLSGVGVPPYDVVRVSGAEDEKFFLLAGDRESVMG
ncbi:MAG: molybdopterin/thiamine biosynthesis adenylyltransferase [Pirellulaceae bacterium]|jgi:molybdopterin/thiamine biosynthesis adenylyltransferase